MNILGWSTLTLPALTFAAAALQPTAREPQSLALSRAGSVRAAPAQEPLKASDWRGRMTAPDLDAREQAFDELVDAAAGNDEALAQLEDWSRDGENPEFAWTCRLALREARARADSSRAFGFFHGSPLQNGGTGLFGDFDALQRELFKNIPDAGAFGSGPLGGRGGWQWFGNPGAFQGGFSANSQGMTLRSTPDGVKLELRRNVDGQEKTEEYSAKSLDELLEAHPELREHVQSFPGGSSVRGRLGFSPFAGGFERAPRTDVLGVYLATESAAVGEDGLSVQRVAPDSIAQRMGIQAGDVILEIDGWKVRSREDISAHMRERARDAEIQVKLRGADGETHTRTWKPDASVPSTGRGQASPLIPPGEGATKI